MRSSPLSLVQELARYPRSLTGKGNRDSLEILKQILPRLMLKSWKSGSPRFDWLIPPEWSVKEAYIETSTGERIAQWRDHFLHLVGYSEPVDLILSLDELQPYLHSIPEMPDAIPYVTSYYKRTWGFCLTHNQRQSLTPGEYRVFINSTLEPGVMDYADLVIEGETTDEVMFSTYICHPTMANNEASGITVATALADWLQSQPRTRYTYRFVFVPETIGAIAYLADNLYHLKTHVRAGFQITCVGDERAYSYLPSRSGSTLSDRVAKHVLKHIDPSYIEYTWLDRGSDERQWCSPGADLPIASIMRSKYGTYPEYHTSLDTLGRVVTERGLNQSLLLFQNIVSCLEANSVPLANQVGEPFLTKYNLRPTLSGQGHLPKRTRALVDFLSIADGHRDLIDIAEYLNLPFMEILAISELLESEGLIATSK